MNTYLSGFNRIFNVTAEDRLNKGSIQCLYDDDRTSERGLNFEDHGELEVAAKACAAHWGIPISDIKSETYTIYRTIPASLGMTFLAETGFKRDGKNWNDFDYAEHLRQRGSEKSHGCL